LNGIIANALE